MARTAQRNIVSCNPSILLINICPLDKSRFIVDDSTMKTFRRFTANILKPTMKSPITYFLALPHVVISPIMVSLFKVFFSCNASFFTSFHEIVISNFGVTLTRAKSSFGNMRRRVVLGSLTTVTIN